MQWYKTTFFYLYPVGGITIYLLLGGNEGDRLSWLEAGRAGISERIGAVVKASAIYETAAWGKENQAAFLNQVVYVSTFLSPQQVLQQITAIELETAGRVRTEKWAPRTLDIDILFYGDAVLHEPGLTIPHAHLSERRFALVPLCDIAADVVHPALKISCAALLHRCEDPLPVRLYKAPAFK